jgi:division protein CdvB (Snf7/Vps24/ESCRT-III family)
MAPVAGVIGSIRGHLSGIVPEVSFKLGEIGDSLNDLVTDSGTGTASTWNVTSSGEDAERILLDANTVAEQKMKEKFPTLPSAVSQAMEGTS